MSINQHFKRAFSRVSFKGKSIPGMDEAFKGFDEAFAKFGESFDKVDWDSAMKSDGDDIDVAESDGTITLKGPVKNVIVNGKVVWSAE